MYLTSLELRNIRIISQCECDLVPGVTVFVGDNGQGKTSILEAMYIASHAKSFRHVSHDDVISTAHDQAQISVHLTDGQRPQDIAVTLSRTERDSYVVNGQKLRRFSDLSGTLRVSIFTPDDLEIIKGSATLRREILDDTLLAVSPKYAAAYSDYSRVVKQKNALLKDEAFDRHVFDVLNDSLIASGVHLLRARLSALTSLREKLADSYHHISGVDSKTDVTYVSKMFGHASREDESRSIDELSEIFREKLEEYHQEEIRRRHCVVGPHRDDLLLTIHDRDTRTRASQGEQRSMALALKMALHFVVSDITGDNPILLLDDVFSELDLGRTHRLIECLPASQTFVTTATEIPSTLKVDAMFHVNNGIVTK